MFIYELAEETKKLLRQQAEEIVRGKVALTVESVNVMPPAAARELVHELQVHQIELELQNEELRLTQLQLEAARARYFDLYDLAPISYCTVNESGIIVEANLATAELFNEVRSNLVGQRISRYIHKDFQDVYYLSRRLLLATGTQQHCELKMLKVHDGDQSFSFEGESAPLWVNVSITSAKDDNGSLVQRVVLTDVTNDKIMAMAMQDSESKLRAIVDSKAFLSTIH